MSVSAVLPLSVDQRRQYQLFDRMAEAPVVQLAATTELRGLDDRLADFMAHQPGLRSTDGAFIPVRRSVVQVTSDTHIQEILREQMREQRLRLAAEWTFVPLDVTVVTLAQGDVVLIAAASWYADLESLRQILRSVISADAADGPVLDYPALSMWLQQLHDTSQNSPERAYWDHAIEQSRAGRRIVPAGLRQCRLGPVAIPNITLTLADVVSRWCVLLALRQGSPVIPLALRAPRRTLVQLDGVIGPLATDVPLLIHLDGCSTLGQASALVSGVLDRAVEQSLHYADAMGDVPSMQRLGIAVESADGLSYDNTQPCELGLTVSPSGASPAFALRYDPELYSAGDVDLISRQFQRVLSAEAHAGWRSLDLLDDAQRALILPSRPVSATGPTETFAQRFSRIAEQHASRNALQTEDETWTYAALARASRQFAQVLRDEGCGPGDRVGLCLGRSSEQVISMLGCLMAGISYVPIDPRTQSSRVNRVAALAKLAAMVTTTDHLDRVSDGDLEVPIIDWTRDRDYILGGAEATPVPVVPECEAYVIFTSGSTGTPKGVSVPHRSLMHYIDAVNEFLALPPEASLGALSTVAADLGYTAVYGALGTGRTLRLLPERLELDAQALAQTLALAPVDCLKIVPTHLAALLAAERAADLLPRHCLVLGGEALPWDLVNRVRSLRPDLRIVNHYGPTETTVGIVCHLVEESLSPAAVSVPIGRAITGSSAMLLDTQLQPCAIGMEGDLYLGGASVATGYLDDAKATAGAFVPDPFSVVPGARMYRSGDRARWTADGQLVFRGRKDRQIKIRGYRVELDEIEFAIRGSCHAEQVAVEVRADDGPARLVAYIGGGDLQQEAAVRAHLAATLPDYMQPSAYVWLDRLPLNANGKLDRAVLSSLQAKRAPVATRELTVVESRLLQLCEELLGLRGLSIDDNFFAIGGDSIFAIQLVARARQLGYVFAPKQIFQSASIGALAALVGEADVSRYTQDEVVGIASLAPVQARHFARIDTDAHHYNQACIYDLPSSATVETLRATAAVLLSHHDVFRARYFSENGAWRQEFVPSTPSLVDRCVGHVTILAGDAPAAREELLQHIQDRQADFVLDTAPQLRMVHVDRPAEGRKQLLVIAHHLVIDAFSWRVLEEDIETLYRQASDGAPLRLPDKTCPYKEWVDNLEALRQQGYWQRDIGYWQAVTGQASQMASVQQAGRSGEVKSRVVQVSESASRALESEAHQAFNTNAQDFLVAALAQAFADVGRHRPLALMLESHGRDSIDDALDVSRTIGWFTNLYPVTVTLPDVDDPVIVLKAVKEHLRAAGGKGMGFGVLNYLGEDTPSMEEPPVCFNYLGRFADGEAASRWVQVSEDVDLAQEGCRSPRQHRLFDIELLALQTESRFQLKLVFDTGCLGDDNAVALCAAFEQRLAAMIDACGRTRGGLTPSDVPDIDLGQQELDDLLQELDAYAGNA